MWYATKGYAYLNQLSLLYYLIAIDSDDHTKFMQVGSTQILNSLHLYKHYINFVSLHVSGVLERPSFPPQLVPDEFQYKIFVSGKTGVGKSSMVARLTANEVPATHNETPGLLYSVKVLLTTIKLGP